MYILSQFFALLSIAVVIFYTVIKISRKGIVIANIFVNLFLMLHYLCLKEYTAAICTFLCGIMVVVYYFKGKTKLLSSFISPIFFMVVMILSSYFTWVDSWSVIPMTGNIILTFTLWNDNENIIKAWNMVIQIMWVVYNTHLHSYTIVIGQTLAFCFNVIYFMRIKHIPFIDTYLIKHKK